MKKLKIIIFTLFIFLITGCGATVNHTMDINTIENTVEISTKIQINESDYQHINGGREQLITIINENKPKELSFSIDEQNQHIFYFVLSFSSYEEYMSKYESITGIKSTSIFDIQDFSKDSPFTSFKNIEINDDLSKLLDWLTNALLTTGTVSQDQKDNLIQQQNYEYTFNKKKQYLSADANTYSEENKIAIYETEANVVIKKNNSIDLGITFYIEEKEANDFSNNFSNYLKEKDVSYIYENDTVQLDGKAYMKYDVSMKNVNVNNNDEVEKINTVFGKDFVIMESTVTKADSFFKEDVYQTLDIQLQFNNLFNRNTINSTTITVDLDELDVDKKKMGDIQFPLTKPLDNSTYQLTVSATYSTIHYYIIAIVIAIVIIICFLLKKFVLKSEKYSLKNIFIKIDFLFTKLIEDQFLEKKFTIDNNIIEGEKFTLQISNINKTDYGQRFSVLTLLYYSMISISGWYALRWLSYEVLANIVLVLGIVWLIGYIKVSRMRVIYIKLVSGKAYSFFFENEDIARDVYLQIIEKIQEQENSIENIDAILKNVEEKENAEI